MTEMGNGGCVTQSTQQQSLHAVTMKSQAYRLAVVLQPSLLCWGEDQLFVTKTDGKTTEIKSVCTMNVTGGVNFIWLEWNLVNNI